MQFWNAAILIQRNNIAMDNHVDVYTGRCTVFVILL